MPSVLLTSVHDILSDYVVAHGGNPNVVLPLVDAAAAEAIAGWSVQAVVVSTTAEAPFDEAQTIQFSAAVQGIGEYSQNVTWSISGEEDEGTTISSAGLLTLDENEFAESVPEHTIVVTATSVDNGAISGTYNVVCVTGYYSVLYDANGGTGTMTDENSPYEDEATVTVLENTFTPAAGKAFDRWVWDNVNPGVSPDPTFTIEGNVTIYALWKTIWTLSYNANGGTGTMTDENSPYDDGDTVTVASSTFTPPTDKLFLKWNTAANGSGTDYAPAATFDIEANTTLYAIWKDTISSVTVKNVADGSSDGTTITEAGTVQFYATVAGSGIYSRDVTWSITGNVDTSGTYISNNGFLVVSAGDFVETHDISVVATSVADPTISDTELVTCSVS